MSATLKKREEIQKRKRALQQEEDDLRAAFVTEFTEILSTLPLYHVDLDVLIGAIATTIDHARHHHQPPTNGAQNDAQMTLWKNRGATELNRFRRQQKINKQEKNITTTPRNTSTSTAKKTTSVETTSTKDS